MSLATWRENIKMKITKRQLRRIIKEELELKDYAAGVRGDPGVAKSHVSQPRHSSSTAQMWADQSDQNLYVNLTDEQKAALDDLEDAVNKCMAAGVTDADMKDTIESRTMS